MQATWSSHLTLRYKAMRITTASSDTMRMMTTNTRCDADDDSEPRHDEDDDSATPFDD
jgi:hypothetical protein